MSRKLDLEHIAKIEGHAKLYIKVSNGEVENVELRVLEGSRFFEGILKGKKFNELSYIASRICGICSVVHSLTALKAIEAAFDIKTSKQTDLLREVLNIGGIIQSHALHLYFLTLPDYIGETSAISMAKKHKNIIERALKLKRLGNQMVFTLAGRDVHPIGCVLGGFSRMPDNDKLQELLEELKNCKQDAVDTVNLFLKLSYPDFKYKTPHFALTGGTYFYSSNVVHCESGMCFPTKEYKNHFTEYLREHSTAEFATQEGKSYFVGALSRIYDNFELLSNESKQYAKKLCDNKDNPFMNIPAQAIELLEGINRSIVILSNLNIKPEVPAEFTAKPCLCEGTAACSAPRGMLFHKYKFDNGGYCTYADITTPTTQNLQQIEESIKSYLPSILGRSPDDIKHEIEKMIRAYDPCISCSTHFLEFEWEAD